MANSRAGFGWYLAGGLCQFMPFGIHNVLYAWLVAVYLGETGIRLGFAQMCSQMPALVFVLFSGLLADRIDRRSILIIAHLLAALPGFLLALAIHQGFLAYFSLIIFAVAVSTFNSFLQPARDSMLNQVAPFDLQKAVTITMGLMFGSQIIGYVLASQADAIGPVLPLLVQGFLHLAGVFFAFKLPRSIPVRESLDVTRQKNRRGVFAEIGEGLVVMFRSPRMSPVLILMLAVGVFYSGAFFVINPLVVRDIYQGGSGDIALSYICFMAGTVLTTVLILAVGGVRQQGRGLMLSLVTGGIALSVTTLGLSFAGYLVMIGLWGVSAGMAMSLGRAIIQESAPENFRARAMSIYTLGNLGGAPIGSLMMGVTSVWLGLWESYLLAFGGMTTMVVLVWIFSSLDDTDRLTHEQLEGVET